MRATGKVKWFSDEKGYGFIVRESTGEDCFVHFSEIRHPGFKTLEDGERVEFDITTDAKGSRAVNVVVLDEVKPYRRGTAA